MRLLIQHSGKLYWSAWLILVLFSCSNPKDHEIAYTWSPVKINTEIQSSAEIDSLVEPYREKLDSIMDEEIGYAMHDLTTDGKYESTLGTYVTKLLLTQSVAEFNTRIDVSVMNHHGGLRAPINQGPITLGEVFAVMPFENEMRLLEISGEQLKEVIEYIGKAERSMIWPVSFEVSKSEIENIRVAGKAIQPEKAYVLAISDYLANGGGGFKMLPSLKRIAIKPVKVRDMIVNDIRQQTANGDSIRITVANYVTSIR
ncbi:MAG: 5'-nucleotidase [Bacteroidota bacterium]